MQRANDLFDWSGGHPALDLANTLDERPSNAPLEMLSRYGDLVRFTALAGLIEPSLASGLHLLSGSACTRVVQRARKLREHLFAVLTARHVGTTVAQTSLDAITIEVRRAHVARAIATSGRGKGVVHCWVLPTSPEVPLYACALSVEELLITADHRRIRKCGAADCEVYFMDTSKAHRRQWCSMENCGNREKQRRWRSGKE
jgi:predicted RNA-binding Zn ribbon-like protein